MPRLEVHESGAIPSLDGIRAIAVGIVFLAHSGFAALVPGGLGVTIFFVLSGYLITTLMRVEHAATGSVSFRAFYLRRGLRLMPPLLVVIALALALSALGVIDGDFTMGGLLSVVFYVGNYFVIAHDFAGLPDGLGVMWSLAVEEHFYLFYPPLALLLLNAGRSRPVAWALGGACLLVLAWRGWLSLAGASDHYITMATDTRIDSILAGCLMGLLWNPWPGVLPKAARAGAAPQRGSALSWRDAALTVGCVALLLVTLVWRDELFRDVLRYTLQSAAIAPLIWLAVARAGAAPFRWLNAAPLAYIGKISYTVYLCHHLFLLLVMKHWPELGWAGTALAGALLTLAVAEPVRRWVERPCARLRHKLHGRFVAPGPVVTHPPRSAAA